MIYISKTKSIYIKSIILILLFLLLFFSKDVYASEFKSAEVRVSNEYIEWLNLSDEEKLNTLMPPMYVVDMSDIILRDNVNNMDIVQVVGERITSFIQKKSSSNYLDSTYNLSDILDIDVRNQELTKCCWAVATLNSMELNIQLTEGAKMNFSERHMDYATSEDFYDGTNHNAFKRSVNMGGNVLIGLAYLTNGQGAVLEEDMPFENNLNKISLNEIEKPVNTYVTDYEILPSIFKVYNIDGSPIYYNSTGELYTENQVKVLRNNIKEHIIKYGGVTAYTASGAYDYYSSPDLVSSKAYYCNDVSVNFDHAITIVGWDDNYSKENFTGKAKPTKDGAYIVLNSYSDEVFNDGYIYISYEDVWIESSLYGISGSSEVDYSKIYQYDNFGGAVPIILRDNLGNTPTVLYYSTIFSRETMEKEWMNAVSVNSADSCRYNIYVNTNGTDLTLGNLTKVATTDILTPGYHKIEFEAVELTGTDFAVVIEAVSMSGETTLMIEPQMDGSFYEYVDSEVGNSKISMNGVNWQNLADIGMIVYSEELAINTAKSDVCIKAFIQEKVEEELPSEDDIPSNGNDDTIYSISSQKYDISDDKYISKINHNTTLKDLLKDMTITGEYKVYTKDEIEVTDFNTLTKTNMYLSLNGEKYYLVVRADLNGDGNVSLIDLSKHLACYLGIEEYALCGAYLKSADLNFDGRFSLIDLSQFIVLYNSL